MPKKPAIAFINPKKTENYAFYFQRERESVCECVCVWSSSTSTLLIRQQTEVGLLHLANGVPQRKLEMELEMRRAQKAQSTVAKMGVHCRKYGDN